MRKNLLYIFTYCCFFIYIDAYMHAQCVEPDNLIYKQNTYYLNGMKVPYTGCIEGYVHNPLHPLGGSRFVKSMLGTYQLSTSDTTVNFGYDYMAYVQGRLENGNEIGIWKLYGREEQLIGTCNFFAEKKYVEVTIFAHDFPIGKGIMYYNRRGKVVWRMNQWEDDYSIAKKYGFDPPDYYYY